MAKATNATYTKLRDGSWGLRITGGTVAAGQRVLAVKRDGTGKDEIVGIVVWSGDGVTLATIARTGDGTYRARRSYGSYRSGAGSAAPVAGYSSYCTGRGGCRCFDCAS